MSGAPRASAAAGDIEGAWSDDGKVRIFRGVPYARPPVGDLRWRPPAALAPWSGVRAATSFGPRSVQTDRDRNSISYFGPERHDEDCLTLNIWSAAPDAGEKRPVMVWFHGGGFAVGSGALPIFNGEALAKRGVVAVTVNHRLGVLGFFAHPELSQESPHGACGNYGLLDLVASLQWVRDNIAAFGGDPDCVTIFGQSVGSAAVNVLMASPLARGLFHRAIAQSGGLMGPVGKPGSGSMLVRTEAEKQGLQYAELLGAKSLADLRAMPAEQVQLSWPASFGRPPVTILDGWLLREEIYETYRAGRQAHVPFITGSNANEGSGQPAPTEWAVLQKSIQNEYGSLAPMILDCYGTQGEASETARRLRGQSTFNWQNWIQACEHARSGASNVYAYYFERKPPFPADMVCFENAPERLGAFHTAEIHYIFGTLDARPWPWARIDRDLSDTLAAYWVNFARSGDPNGPGLPDWAAFDGKSERVQIFGDTTRTGMHPLRKELAMWDACMARLRAFRREATQAPAQGG